MKFSGFHAGSCAFLLLFSVVQSTFSQAAPQDRIYLKSGKVVIGRIVERIPDKAVIIETSSGTEIIDSDDIKKINKYNPSISTLEPLYGAPGSMVKINGVDFGEAQGKNGVRFASMFAVVNSWSDNEIVVTVPSSLQPDNYTVNVVLGDAIITAPRSFTVNAEEQVAAGKASESTMDYVTREDEEEDVSSFLMHFGYAMPLKELAATEGRDAGFAKGGFNFGFEGRIGLTEWLYMPINMQLGLLGYNTDELNSRAGFTVSSSDKVYLFMSITTGLGIAIHLSSTSYLFFSGEYGGMNTAPPDVTYQTSSGDNSVTGKGAFAPAVMYSVGFTINNSVTLAYRTISSKPKITYEFSSGTFTSTSEREIPVAIGSLYIGIAF